MISPGTLTAELSPLHRRMIEDMTVRQGWRPDDSRPSILILLPYFLAGELGFEPRLAESESEPTAFHSFTYRTKNGGILRI